MSLTIRVLKRGDSDRLCPVHARSEFLCATIQSCRPSKCTITSDVMGDLSPMSAVYGDVEVIFW